jgi:hypothetical protein
MDAIFQRRTAYLANQRREGWHRLQAALVDKLKWNEDRLRQQIQELVATRARLNAEVAERQAAERIVGERLLGLGCFPQQEVPEPA